MTEDSAPYTVTPEPPAAYVPPPPEKKAFLAAFAAAQGEYLPIVRNKMATIRPSREKREQGAEPYTFMYAELAQILDACRPALCKNGLSIRSRILPSNEAGHIWLQSILGHAEGWEDISEMHVLVAPEIKAFGAQLTFLRRYVEAPQLGVASEDDLDQDGRDQGEGEGRVGTGAAATPAARKTPQPKPKPAGTLRGELAGSAPAEPPADAVGAPATPDDALAEIAGAEPPAPAGEPITAGQAKFLSTKLSAFYTPDEARDWLGQRGVTNLEQLPASRFDELKAEIKKLEG